MTVCADPGIWLAANRKHETILVLNISVTSTHFPSLVLELLDQKVTDIIQSYNIPVRGSGLYVFEHQDIKATYRYDARLIDP